MKNLANKVVVITGAGSGIGRALALDLAARGSILALSDVVEAGLAETTHRARSAGAPAVQSELLDVSDREAVGRYAESIAARFGRVNVVINNAGVALDGSFADVGYDDMEWIMGVNFWGVVHGTKAFLPHLIASGDGHLVNISSLFGLLSVPNQSLYNASKYAVRGLSEALRQEMLVAHLPVGVTVVHPGGVRTGIARSARNTGGRTAEEIQAANRHFDEKLARTSPERAARIIIRGVQRNRARVLVGADAHVLHTFAKIAGSRYQDVFARYFPRVTRP
ncbi:SDR family NAD(P)-dependent oxidoreductase [Planctomonas deserti]|uniref:SDR family NAD(P)-dependent oxidoreductase n=1 Tax=Planctomonas deserti TaxID=2144185 RepID=UPI000D3621C0|nr:SDR family NAD(P)-dependent oxidoreductase [Planctomonas deserti]